MLRVVSGAVEKLHARLINPVRRKFSRVASSLMYESPMLYGYVPPAHNLTHQRHHSGSTPAADFCVVQLLQQIFIRRFPRCSGLTSSVAGKRCSVSERKPCLSGSSALLNDKISTLPLKRCVSIPFFSFSWAVMSNLTYFRVIPSTYFPRCER